MVGAAAATDSPPTNPKELRAPAGKRLRGLAPTEGGVGFVVVRPASYTGKRAVTVRAYAAPKATGEVTGRIYALAR